MGVHVHRQLYLRLAYTPHWLPLVVFGAWSGALIVLGLRAGAGWWAVPLWLALGAFFWTLLEYLLHRFTLHADVHTEPWRFMTSGVHLLHHAQPDDEPYTAAPLLLSMPVYAVLMGAVYLVAGMSPAAHLFVAGIGVGYLIYERVHFATHQPGKKSRIGHYLRRYHMIHHFRDHEHYFGVTSPLWDMVFRTKPPVPVRPQNDSE